MDNTTVTLTVNEELWKEFKEKALLKHRRRYGALGEEVEKALEYYLRRSDET